MADSAEKNEGGEIPAKRVKLDPLYVPNSSTPPKSPDPNTTNMDVEEPLVYYSPSLSGSTSATLLPDPRNRSPNSYCCNSSKSLVLESPAFQEFLPSRSLTNDSSETSLLHLSDDVLLLIMARLKSCDLLSLSRSCRRLAAVSLDHTLWSRADCRDRRFDATSLDLVVKHLLGASTLRFAVDYNNFDDAPMPVAQIMQSLKENCPRLHTLILENVEILSTELKIEDFPRTLHNLSLKGSLVINKPSTTSYLYNMSVIMPSLEVLILSDCFWFEAHSLLAIAKCSKLKELRLNGCRQLGNCLAYCSMAARFSFNSLEILDLRGTHMGDSEVACFNRVTTLRHLYLSAPPVNPPQRVPGEVRRNRPWPAGVTGGVPHACMIVCQRGADNRLVSQRLRLRPDLHRDELEQLINMAATRQQHFLNHPIAYPRLPEHVLPPEEALRLAQSPERSYRREEVPRRAVPPRAADAEASQPNEPKAPEVSVHAHKNSSECEECLPREPQFETPAVTIEVVKPSPNVDAGKEQGTRKQDNHEIEDKVLDDDNESQDNDDVGEKCDETKKKCCVKSDELKLVSNEGGECKETAQEYPEKGKEELWKPKENCEIIDDKCEDSTESAKESQAKADESKCKVEENQCQNEEILSKSGANQSKPEKKQCKNEENQQKRDEKQCKVEENQCQNEEILSKSEENQHEPEENQHEPEENQHEPEENESKSEENQSELKTRRRRLTDPQPGPSRDLNDVLFDADNVHAERPADRSNEIIVVVMGDRLRQRRTRVQRRAVPSPSAVEEPPKSQAEAENGELRVVEEGQGTLAPSRENDGQVAGTSREQPRNVAGTSREQPRNVAPSESRASSYFKEGKFEMLEAIDEVVDKVQENRVRANVPIRHLHLRQTTSSTCPSAHPSTGYFVPPIPRRGTELITDNAMYDLFDTPQRDRLLYVRLGCEPPASSRLESLVVRGYRGITDNTLLVVAEVETIQYVDVSGTSVTRAAVEMFKRLRPDVDIVSDYCTKDEKDLSNPDM